MIIEEEVKPVGEINPDALEAVFDEVLVEEEVIVFTASDDEQADDIDIAFQANDEEYW